MSANMLDALKAIADLKVSKRSNHAELSALAIGIARVSLQHECCGDAVCYNESCGLPCAAMDVKIKDPTP